MMITTIAVGFMYVAGAFNFWRTLDCIEVGVAQQLEKDVRVDPFLRGWLCLIWPIAGLLLEIEAVELTMLATDDNNNDGDMNDGV